MATLGKLESIDLKWSKNHLHDIGPDKFAKIMQKMGTGPHDINLCVHAESMVLDLIT